ncbi:ESX secretion-associated protein EspG [Amycolatopsis sulphurea]|uniref:ESX secretion-associated protein EspG n=1 Tax=Amycolatopsis sulphurea TaxID=76022 RepID=UPI000BFA28D5|nr:ESX secretion-associated protein EspG [Amycolatopsis sulphurea]
MLVHDRALVLPVGCLALAAELAGVSLPAALAGAPVWRAPERSRSARDGAAQALSERGIGNSAGLRADFARTMIVLCRGVRELSALVDSGPDRRYRVLASAEGQDAVLACRAPSSDHVLVRPARADALAEELAGELPANRPGVGPAMSVPEADLRRAMDGAPPRRDVRRVMDVAGLPRSGAAQFAAATRDRIGGRRISGGSLCTYYDTSRGRYLFSVNGEPGQGRYVNVAPARPETLIAQLRALVS